MKNLLITSMFLSLSLGLVAQYPAGMSDLTSVLGVELTSTDDRGGTFESTLLISGDLMFFTATDATYGEELYVTDGTVAGTKLLKDINSGVADASPKYMIDLGNKVYFQANDGTNGAELWETDGTEAGTKMIADIYSGSDGSTPELITPFGTKLIFRAQTVSSEGDGEKWLHIYDPALGTVTLVSAIQPRSTGDSQILKIQVDETNNVAYFIGEPKGENQEVYLTDGTEAGTIKIKDVTPEELGASGIQWLVVHNNHVLWRQKTPKSYAADPSLYTSNIGEQVWVSDGTEAGTHLLKHINPTVGDDGEGNGTQFAWPTSFDGKLYFRSDDGTHGVELWVSEDLTDANTYMIKDLADGADNNWAEDFGIYKGYLCFNSTSDDGEGYELRYLDPNDSDNPVKLMASANSSGDAWIKRTTAYQYDGVDSLVFFTADNGDNVTGTELFVASGVGNQAKAIFQLHPDGSVPYNMRSWNNALYFTSQNVKKLLRYEFVEAPKLSASGITANYQSFADTFEINVTIDNYEMANYTLLKVEQNDDAQLFKTSSSLDGPFSYDPIQVDATDGTAKVYAIVNNPGIDPDNDFILSSSLRVVPLDIVNLDTLALSVNVILEPVFRNEVVYHVVMGNDTNFLDNSVDVVGAYNSAFDKAYGEDAITNKSWGYTDAGWSNSGTWNKWQTMRERTYENENSALTYEFELEPGDYVAQLALYENWNNRAIEIAFNDVVLDTLIVRQSGDYDISTVEFTIPTGTDKLTLKARYATGVTDYETNNPYLSWLKIGRKCVADNCTTSCFEPMCELRAQLSDAAASNDEHLALVASPLKIYPNPANTNVTIELKENDYSLIIYNVAGVAVKRLKVSDKTVKIDTQQLLSGIYFVVATTKDGVTQMEKLIINK